MGGWSSGAWVDRMYGLAGLLGEPQHAQQSIHITGTNGEGSTVRMVTALLAAHDLSVGTYTSPDLDRINERLSRNGESILRSFVDREIDAPTFQTRFLAWWKEDRDSGVTTGQLLDDLMTGVDCYDENPDVRYRIDAEQLRLEASEALRRLDAR